MNRDECLQEFEANEADPIDAVLYCKSNPTSSNAGGVLFVLIAIAVSIVWAVERSR